MDVRLDEAGMRVLLGWQRDMLRRVEGVRMSFAGCGDKLPGEMLESLTRAVDTLCEAERIWRDGADSIGGVMPGGIFFGVVSREVDPERYMPSEAVPLVYTIPLEWTFHS